MIWMNAEDSLLKKNFSENMFNDDETKTTEKIYIQFILSDKN